MYVSSDETAADVRVVSLEGNFDTAAAQVHGKYLTALADCSAHARRTLRLTNKEAHTRTR